MVNIFYRLAQLFSQDARNDTKTAQEYKDEKKRSEENWVRIQKETQELQDYGHLKHLFNTQKSMTNEQLIYLDELSQTYAVGGGTPWVENVNENHLI